MFCLDDMMSMSHDVGYSHVMDGCVSQLLYHQRLSFCGDTIKYSREMLSVFKGKARTHLSMPTISCPQLVKFAVKKVTFCLPQIGLLIFQIVHHVHRYIFCG